MIGKALSIIQNITLGIVAHAPMENAPAEVMKVVGILNDAITTNPDIALACILFKQTAEGYSNRHLMDAAILSIMVARSMQISTSEAESIAAAALTMNIGMLRLQEDLQNRAEPPTDEERLLIRKHPELSASLLKDAGVIDPLWLACVLSHHENVDGSGYPTGITVDSISDGAKIIAVADRYTAMIAPRKFRKAIHPTQALRNLLIDGGKTNDEKITAFFIKELGIYPPGCCVKLVSGETAIVMFKGITATTPAVQAIRNQLGDELPYPENRNSGTERFAIKEGVLLEAKEIPFTMQQIWGAHAT
jgi:HD-GYP domain-containing protein (c-di-GMP phosphodiesterase class II)